jgi:uncharacterized protein YybS (DUF2232 family)
MVKKILRILIATFIIMFSIVAFWYVDFYFITKFLPLPDDICYYHANHPPLWVDLFYLDGMGHTEPPFSGLHIILNLTISLTVGIYVVKKTNKWLVENL